MPADLLEGTKEFYRRLRDENANLQLSSVSASQQAGTVRFETEPFVTLFHEAFIEGAILAMRPNGIQGQIERLEAMARAEPRTVDKSVEINVLKLETIRPIVMQQIWDQMFMIDLYPENKSRFGLDLRAIVERISAKN